MAELKVHILNVGHGDCAVISHPLVRLTMIDINNGCALDEATYEELAKYYPLEYSQRIRASVAEGERIKVLTEKGYNINLTNPLEFLKNEYPGTDIWRFIQTHPHMDHMRGLAAIGQDQIGIANFWDTDHDYVPDDLTEADLVDWDEYQGLRSGKRTTKVLRLFRGAQALFYGEDPEGVPPGDGIKILHPPVGANTSADSDENANNLSYILRIEYNGIVFIFGGDAEEPVWKEVAEACPELLKCHVLKASHHGRDTGYCENAVKLMQPQYTVVSVGNKPDTDASNKYRKHSQNVWSTRWRGNITVTVPEQGQARIESEYER